MNLWDVLVHLVGVVVTVDAKLDANTIVYLVLEDALMLAKLDVQTTAIVNASADVEDIVKTLALLYQDRDVKELLYVHKTCL